MDTSSKAAPYPVLPLLILDDEEHFRSAIARQLRLAGIDNIVSVGESETARPLVFQRGVSLVLLDLQLPGTSGERLLEEFTAAAPEIPIIIVTGNSGSETIVRCMRSGATDYLVKPIEEARLLTSVWNGLSIFELKRELTTFRDGIFGRSLGRPELFKDIVTVDDGMLALFRYIEAVAASRQPVLIIGETGTGKELFARAVHEASGRNGRFVAVNVGGLDDAVFTDTLFGHRRGAYTGAEGARAGLVSEAKGGTLFLDEIGDLEGRSQIKLLRLLQESEYYPLGSDQPQRSESRIVAATTRDLKAAVAAGSFRADLYYRLQTHPIEIPPLRRRRVDIRPLADHFLARSASSLGKPEPILSEECRDRLRSYDFPGNVRELESLIHDAVAGSVDGRVDSESFLSRITLPYSPEAGSGPPPGRSREDELPICVIGDVFPSLKEAELALVRLALKRCNGNVSLAASMLGISRQTVYKWLAEMPPA